MKHRRDVLCAGSIAVGTVISGCLSGQNPATDDGDLQATGTRSTTGARSTTDTRSTAATTSEGESPATLDYSVDDLLVSNRTEKRRTVDVRVSPEEGDVEPFTDEFELEPKADDADHAKVYPELEAMSHEARVTLDVTGFEPWSHAWQGDAVDDHLGLHVYVKPDGLEIVGKVA